MAHHCHITLLTLEKHNASHHDDGLGRAVSVAQAVVGQQAQERVEEQRGQVTEVEERLHQRDGAHGPVAAQLRGVQQEPCVHRKQVVESQLSGGRGADGCRVIKSARKKKVSGQMIGNNDFLIKLQTSWNCNHYNPLTSSPLYKPCNN